MSNKKIDNLTAEQEAKLDLYYEKWLAIGMQARETTALDKAEAEKAMLELYAQQGLNPPEHLIWCKSPMQAAKKCIELGDKDSSLVYASGYGNQDAGWLSYYDFIATELGLVDECKELFPLMKIANHCGWYFPYENAVIFSELPLDIRVDAEGNLHNQYGPALVYGDGEQFYFLNGIKTEEWFFDDNLSIKDKVKKTLALTNTEQRMICMKYLGMHNFLKQLDAKKIHEDGDYELYTLGFNDNRIGPFLKMTCPSTGREFFEGVGDATKYEFLDTSIKTCQDALEWRAKEASKKLMTKYNLNWTYRA